MRALALEWRILAVVFVLLAASFGTVVACGGDDDDDDDDSSADDDVTDDDSDDDSDDDDADDDSDDDTDDDDSGDDDTADDDTVDDDDDDDACEIFEEEACAFFTETCDDLLGFGTTEKCISSYYEDCEAASIGDSKGFGECLCDCKGLDKNCVNEDGVAKCESECFEDFCGTL
ncbi:MAG: hypothetical protein H6683_02860 [Deltaproteobacteria bacterium]|nr:hypothetical protein [Deltaproteobacteria bacterium]MCB9478596.1 hypothetical protein [Deltaproteobacteria bacterium]